MSPHRTVLLAALLGALATIVAVLLTSPWRDEVGKLFGGEERQVLVHVTDRRGAGIRGAEVLLFAEGGPYSTATDSHGAASLTLRPASARSARLVVRSADYEIFEQSIQPSHDRLMNVRLSPRNLETAKVLFRVVDGARGEPITGAEVQLFLGADPYLQVTDANGLVKFAADFQDGKAEAPMSVRTSSYAIEYQRITLRPDTVQDVLLDRHAGTLTVAVPATP